MAKLLLQRIRYFHVLVALVIVFLLFRLLQEQPEVNQPSGNDHDKGLKEVIRKDTIVNIIGEKSEGSRRDKQLKAVDVEKGETIPKPKPPCLEFDINYVEENYYSLDQKDPQLIQYTRMRYLTPPSKLEYNKLPAYIGKTWHVKFALSLFGGKRNGIFIEAGANDGGGTSSTLYLEKELGWTGLLVECNPKVIPSLKTRHRKAWIGNVCLAPTTTPGVMEFSNPTNWTFSGTIRKPWDLPVPTTWEFFDVETMPLYTLLAALGWKEIDFFQFDIEGSELSVLKNFPFDEIIFKVIVIETYFYKKDELTELDNLLKSNDYDFAKKTEWDIIYVHKSVKDLVPWFVWPF